MYKWLYSLFIYALSKGKFDMNLDPLKLAVDAAVAKLTTNAATVADLQTKLDAANTDLAASQVTIDELTTKLKAVV
jgi:hypothetical protein